MNDIGAKHARNKHEVAIMKAAYIGIDNWYPVLTSLYDTGTKIIKIFTCKTDNYTEFNTRTTAFAKEHDIPLQIERIKRDNLYALVDMGCDFVLVGGYYHVIPVIDELRIVNTHPALLPMGRGGWPMPLTIIKGLAISGVTMHRMTMGLDEGEIILKESVPVYPDDNLVTLCERQNAKLPGMVNRLVADFDNLWNNAVPQTGDAEYWELPTEEDYTLRDTDSYEKAELTLRAFYGYECFYIDSATNEKYEMIGAVAHKGEAPKEAQNEKIFSISGGYITSPRTRSI
jgi:methionyl-tRNA formyltransferase